MSLKLRFVKSAGQKSDYPLDTRGEIAIAGRSNAGKSTFINALAGKKIAKTSQWPGKTACLNFFMVNEAFYLVDMPGYGYAKRSGKEKQAWADMIEGYLNHRKNLKSLLLITDIRRSWKPEEDALMQWCRNRGIPLVVILNKIDKVGQSERVLKTREYKAIDGVDDVYCVSSEKGKGISKVVDQLFQNVSDQGSSQ